MHPSAPQLLWVPSKIGIVYSTWSPTDKDAAITLSNGNLTAASNTSSSTGVVRGSASKSAGKLYFEQTSVTSAVTSHFGLANGSAGLTIHIGEDVNGWGYSDQLGGLIRNNASNAASGFAGPATNDVVGIHVDFTNLKLYFRLNGTNLGSMDPAAGTGGLAFSAGSWFPAFSAANNGSAATLNVGASAFGTSPASGFSAWG